MVAVSQVLKLLVIIDMQPAGFPLALGVTRQVMREIRKAVELGWLIVVVEYVTADDCAGPTDTRITTLLDESGARWIRVKKKSEDGSTEIVEALAGLLTGAYPRFRVVGVTTDDCVTKTVHGLIRLLPSCVVDVVTDACSNWEGRRYNWAAFSTSSRVNLLTCATTEGASVAGSIANAPSSGAEETSSTCASDTTTRG